MAVTANSKILASDISGAIKSITRSGTTFTYTRLDGSTGTFTQQDNNTTYSAATSSALGLVKIGSNISVSSGTISLSKTNVTSALGYTPPTSAGISTVKGQIGSIWAANNTSMTLPSGGTWNVFNIPTAISTNTTNGSASFSFYVSNSSNTNTSNQTNGYGYAGGTTVYAKTKSRFFNFTCRKAYCHSYRLEYFLQQSHERSFPVLFVLLMAILGAENTESKSQEKRMCSLPLDTRKSPSSSKEVGDFSLLEADALQELGILSIKHLAELSNFLGVLTNKEVFFLRVAVHNVILCLSKSDSS